MNDNVNHPSHYTSGKVECIDAIESAVDGLVGKDAALTAQVIKYMWRWKRKNGIEDLKKAQWYLNRLIAAQEQPVAMLTTPAAVTSTKLADVGTHERKLPKTTLVPHDCATCKHEYEPQGFGPCFTCSVVAREHWEAKDRG